jgi:heme A synthase
MFAYLGVLALGITGAITALGDTLFPAESLAQGVSQDFSPQAHFLIRLRVWHPLIAITVAFYTLFLAGLVAMFRVTSRIRRIAAYLALGFVLQLLAGLVNLVLLAPVWMQILHLLLADLVWIGLVLLGAANFAESEIHQTEMDVKLAVSAKF